VLAAVLGGCAVDADTPAGEQRSPATTTVQEEPGPQPWTEVTDGTWDYGDQALGEPTTSLYSAYAISVIGPPTLTTSDGGKTVRMASPLHIERVVEQARGNDPDEPISHTEHFSFSPGYFDLSKHDEVYGDDVEINCDHEARHVGEVALCTLAFTAPADEIPNSYWHINQSSMAAWPGQHP